MLTMINAYWRKTPEGTLDLMLEYEPNHFISYRAAQHFGFKFSKEVQDEMY